MPSGEWFCPNCVEDLTQAGPPSPIGGVKLEADSKKRKTEPENGDNGDGEDDDASEEEDVKPAAKKRKGAAGAKKRK